jgi:hypothetical protein
VEFDDRAEGFDFWTQDVGGQVLGLVCGSNGGSENEWTLDVTDDVTFESVEEARFRLAAVTHLLIDDRDASVDGNAAFNAQLAATAGIWLEILLDDLLEKIEGFFHLWLMKRAFEIKAKPRSEPLNLGHQALQRVGLGDWVIPVDV